MVPLTTQHTHLPHSKAWLLEVANLRPQEAKPCYGEDEHTWLSLAYATGPEFLLSCCIFIYCLEYCDYYVCIDNKKIELNSSKISTSLFSDTFITYASTYHYRYRQTHYSKQNDTPPPPTNNEMLTQYLLNVGSPSATLAQQ